MRREASQENAVLGPRSHRFPLDTSVLRDSEHDSCIRQDQSRSLQKKSSSKKKAKTIERYHT